MPVTIEIISDERALLREDELEVPLTGDEAQKAIATYRRLAKEQGLEIAQIYLDGFVRGMNCALDDIMTRAMLAALRRQEREANK
jgi:hypothetical protein